MIELKTINPKSIKKQINSCFVDWNPSWERDIGNPLQQKGFKYYLEHEAGIKIDFVLNNDIKGAYYSINTIEIVDEPKFTWWMLKWS